jgi:hypothetical protein
MNTYKKRILPRFIRWSLTTSIAVISIISSMVNAEQHSVGEYTVHYSLINSSFLEAKVATQYGLKRSKNIALLNISVIQNPDTPQSTAVISNVFGNGVSLAGQMKQLAFREIKDGDAIYYLATFPINNGERLSFDLQVQPLKQGKIIPIKFKQQVFVN